MIDQISFFLTDVSFESALAFFSEYQYFIALTMPVIFGELGLYLFGLLLGMDSAFYPAVILSLLSIVFYDTIVYSVVMLTKGRYNVLKIIERIPVLSHIDRIFIKCEQEYRDHTFFLLLAIKTLPLTKVIIFFFALRQNMPIGQFIIKDIFATFIWASAILIPGWFVGHGALTFTEGQTISTFILYFILFVIVMLFAGKYIEKGLHWVMKKLM